MVCGYELSDSTIKVDCMGCIYGSNIEDCEVCMGKTIDKLLECKGAGRVVLSHARETEYDFEQIRMLVEIGKAYDEILNVKGLLTSSNIGPSGCERFYPRRMSAMQFLIMEVLRKDPIGAYVRLNRMIKRTEMEAEKAHQLDRRCHHHYLKNVLLPIKQMLDKCTLIKRAKPYLHTFRPGDRSIYRKIFRSIVRPSFMFTRFIVTPPKEGVLVEKYMVAGNILVQIFRVPEKVRLLYHIMPSEFKLGEEKYVILEQARKYLAAHRPTETEFAEPEKTREIFLNIGRDLIKDLATRSNIGLTTKELEELAVILARYTSGFGILELLLADERIQDIFINSPIGIFPIFITHSDFEECETNLIPTKDDAETWATRFRLYSGRPLDEANPVLDTELLVPGGRARVTAITRTLSPEGLAFAFRRHREKPWTFPLFMKYKMFDSLYAGLMSFIIDGGRALLIAGGRGSGKTSLLGSMMVEVMRKFRIICQEDTLELPVVELRDLGYNVERLKSRSVITRVQAEMTAEEALRTSLRLGDSVLMVGEIRSLEGKALFEAMRIGAMSNMVAGTIHAESAYGVYDRVVNDLGVPSTSFKAIDLITICNMLKSPDGLRRFRRVTEVTEVRKKWKDDPADEGGFVNLMEYSSREDKLKPTDALVDGESEVLNEIAKRVREWRGAWDLVWDNILLRAKIKQTMLDYAETLKRPELIEAEWVAKANEAFHVISQKVLQEVGTPDSKMVYEKWVEWFKQRIG